MPIKIPKDKPQKTYMLYTKKEIKNHLINGEDWPLRCYLGNKLHVMLNESDEGLIGISQFNNTLENIILEIKSYIKL